MCQVILNNIEQYESIQRCYNQVFESFGRNLKHSAVCIQKRQRDFSQQWFNFKLSLKVEMSLKNVWKLDSTILEHPRANEIMSMAHSLLSRQVHHVSFIFIGYSMQRKCRWNRMPAMHVHNLPLTTF